MYVGYFQFPAEYLFLAGPVEEPTEAAGVVDVVAMEETLAQNISFKVSNATGPAQLWVPSEDFPIPGSSSPERRRRRDYMTNRKMLQTINSVKPPSAYHKIIQMQSLMQSENTWGVETYNMDLSLSRNQIDVSSSSTSSAAILKLSAQSIPKPLSSRSSIRRLLQSENTWSIETYDLDPYTHPLPTAFRSASQVGSISVSTVYIAASGDNVYLSMRTKVQEPPSEKLSVRWWNPASSAWELPPGLDPVTYQYYDHANSTMYFAIQVTTIQPYSYTFEAIVLAEYALSSSSSSSSSHSSSSSSSSHSSSSSSSSHSSSSSSSSSSHSSSSSSSSVDPG